MIGKVKWFNNDKGFGFIVSQDLKEDIFIHYSNIKDNITPKCLYVNQLVTFDLEKGENGKYFAKNLEAKQNEILSYN